MISILPVKIKAFSERYLIHARAIGPSIYSFQYTIPTRKKKIKWHDLAGLKKNDRENSTATTL